MTTEELVGRCIKRDKLAWNEFVLRYEGLVRRAVHYKLNRMNSRYLRSEADDVIQEVFLMLWRDNKLSKIRDISSLKSWLVIVTINKTSNYCKHRWRDQQKLRSLSQTLTEDGFTLEDVIPDRNYDPARAFDVKEMRKIVSQRINSLRKKERRALELNLMGGKRQSDVAKVMDIPIGTAASLIGRAKRKLQKGIREYCLS